MQASRKNIYFFCCRGQNLQLNGIEVGEMEANERLALVSTVLETISKPERAQLVQEQLVAMPTDERADMLGAIFGLMTKDQRLDIQERLAKTTLGDE